MAKEFLGNVSKVGPEGNLSARKIKLIKIKLVWVFVSFCELLCEFLWVFVSFCEFF